MHTVTPIPSERAGMELTLFSAARHLPRSDLVLIIVRGPSLFASRDLLFIQDATGSMGSYIASGTRMILPLIGW